jgi:hypothetical protein
LRGIAISSFYIPHEEEKLEIICGEWERKGCIEDNVRLQGIDDWEFAASTNSLNVYYTHGYYFVKTRNWGYAASREGRREV